MKNINTKKAAVLIGLVIFLILAVIVISVNSDKNKKKQETDNKADVSVTRTDLKNDASLEQQTANEQTDVEILFENKAVPVGTSLKVTAIVTPDDDDKSIVWTSSDTNVFTVDKDGVITITGVGTATLTATVGNVSDAVVIEGIRNAATGSSNGFSVYTPSAGSNSAGSGSLGNSLSENNASGSSGGTGSSTGGTYSTGSSGNSGSAGTGVSDSGNSQQGGNVSDGSSGNGSNGSGTQSGGNTGNSGSTDGSSSSDNNSGGSDSGEIADAIINNGFEQTVSNVYVCQQNGTYYGEIITQSNVTIIYIKKRSSDFDSRINNVIENLLPGNSQTVWNNYLSASTDRTFTVDGRMVRIVAATGGGHSQIVIYN